MDTAFLNICDWLGSFSPESLLLISFLVSCFFILLSFRFFGAYGLICYGVVAILLGNLQVLKLGKFSFLDEPVALGTVIFTSLFIVSDILTEHYGQAMAKRAVFLNFLMSLFVILSMLPIIAHPEETHTSSLVHQSLTALFVPSARILTASLISFVVSQYVDIYIFAFFKKRHGKKFLWVRTNISSVCSGFFDNVLFSLLAWVILAPNPLPFKTVFIGFIGFSQLVRVMVSVISTPLLYLSYRLKPHGL